MSDLKPCMCCESNDIEIITYEEKYHTRKIATCMDCGARGSVCDSKEEAIEAWNTRPAEDAKDKEIERLKGELRNLSIELNNINICTDNILNKADFGSKATKAEMHSRLTSIYVYASHIKRALARTDDAPDAGKMEEA